MSGCAYRTTSRCFRRKPGNRDTSTASTGRHRTSGVREMTTGKSRLEVARGLGIDFKVTPDLGLVEGIEAARLFLPRCWFDAAQCEAGIEALTHYRKKWNERLQQFEGSPEHDFASHGADAFRYLAVRHKPPQPPKKRDIDPFMARSFGRARERRLGWMA